MGTDIVPKPAHTLSVGTGINCREQTQQTKQNTTIIAWCLESPYTIPGYGTLRTTPSFIQ